MKRVGGNKLPQNIPIVPLDKVSFHYEESITKWRYVFHKHITSERELFEDDKKCNEIMELFNDAKAMKNTNEHWSFLSESC